MQEFESEVASAMQKLSEARAEMVALASAEKSRGGDIQRGRPVDTKPPGGDDDKTTAGVRAAPPVASGVKPKPPQLAAAAWLQSEASKDLGASTPASPLDRCP